MQAAGGEGWRRRLREPLARRFGIDPRALAAYRIAAAALIVVDLLFYRLPDLGAFYTDAGVLPRSVLAEVFPVASALSLHTVTGAWAGQFALLAALLAAAVALLVGYRTRWAAVATWVLLASMQARNPHIANAGDTLLLVTLFFGLFCPLGERWSLDRLAATDEAREGLVLTSATVGFVLQVVVVYATNAAFKARGPRWTDGSAVRYVFALDDYTVGLGDLLAQVPELLVVGNWVWFAAVAASPLLVVLAGWPRAAYAGLLAGLHLVMLATLALGVFPLVSIAALLALLPEQVWDRVEAEAGGRAEQAAAWLGPYVSRQRGLEIPGAVRELGREVVHSALVVLVVAGLVWHAMALGVVGEPAALEQAGRVAEHDWRMFAPASTTYGSVAAPTELANGDRVDAIRQVPADRPPPDELAEAYPSTLWHRYLKDLPDLGDREQAALASHLCQRTAETHEATAEQITLVYVEREVRLDEPDPVERHNVHSQRCTAR
jgi:hypothetical protein